MSARIFNSRCTRPPFPGMGSAPGRFRAAVNKYRPTGRPALVRTEAKVGWGWEDRKLEAHGRPAVGLELCQVAQTAQSHFLAGDERFTVARADCPAPVACPV